jgi:hypothetical protein
MTIQGCGIKQAPGAPPGGLHPAADRRRRAGVAHDKSGLTLSPRRSSGEVIPLLSEEAIPALGEKAILAPTAS